MLRRLPLTPLPVDRRVLSAAVKGFILLMMFLGMRVVAIARPADHRLCHLPEMTRKAELEKTSPASISPAPSAASSMI